MNTKTIVLLIALIGVIAAGVWLSGQTAKPVPVVATDKEYSSPEQGISFKYPAKYMAVEKDLGNGERSHKQIMLVEDTAENRAVLSGELPGREGPVAIYLDIYQNLENQGLENWIKGTKDSNYKLSPDGTISTTTINGRPALTYSWDGLYRGDTIAVSGDGHIAAWSVTYLEPTDSIIADFRRVVQSFSWNK